MNDRERQIVDMVGGEGWSYADTAAVLGVEPATVRAYAKRLADRLRLPGTPRDGLVRLHCLNRESGF